VRFDINIIFNIEDIYKRLNIKLIHFIISNVYAKVFECYFSIKLMREVNATSIGYSVGFRESKRLRYILTRQLRNAFRRWQSRIRSLYNLHIRLSFKRVICAKNYRKCFPQNVERLS